MILHLLGAFALSCCLGASVCSLGHTENQNNDIQFQASKKQVSYDDENYTITLTAEELNNYTWFNLFDVLNNNDIYELDFSNTYIVYDNSTYSYHSYDIYDSLFYGYSGVDIGIYLDDADYGAVFFLNDGTGNLPFEYNISWYLSTHISDYSVIKGAIELDIQANQPQDDLPSVMTDFVGILTSSIGTLASGIAGGVVSMASALFLTLDAGGNVTGLSIFGGIVAIFAGLALAVGITTKVYQWVTSLGN